VFENWLFGRASVLASPDFQGFPEKLGLARTLALPRLGFQTGANGEMQGGPSLSPEREGRADGAVNKSPALGVSSFL